MSFSQRFGFRPTKVDIQATDMDEDLRNGLWNILSLFCWNNMKGVWLPDCESVNLLCQKIWMHHFKKPIDEIDARWENTLFFLKTRFFESAWHEAYSFIEFVGGSLNDKDNFFKFCNKMLEQEMSAYRFIDEKLTPITDEQEIKEIEKSIDLSSSHIKEHLQRSLELLSDRKEPDYRNSIKESISAVESLVASQLNEKSGTLGKLLDKLEKDRGLHPALKKAFSSLYGYTSNKGGIRHALAEKDNVDFHDAKFMLVTCSAFINYVQGKSENK